MFKRTCIGLIVVLLIPLSITARPLVSFGAGSVNQLQLDFIDEGLNATGVIDVHNWATGFEGRLRLFVLNLESYLLFQQGEIISVDESGMPIFKDDIAQRIFGMSGIGFSTRAAVATTLSFTVGTLMGFDITQGFGVKFWAGSPANIYSKENWEDFLQNISLAYRVRLDFNLSRFSFGIHYQIPSSGFSYGNISWEALEPDWHKGRLGASFITRIF
ncbi:MAG: hypothetical protein WC224_02585 [Sphaerochaetaceae bacterium]